MYTIKHGNGEGQLIFLENCSGQFHVFYMRKEKNVDKIRANLYLGFFFDKLILFKIKKYFELVWKTQKVTVWPTISFEG